MEQIQIDKSGEESLISGHLWVFSNQIKRRPSGLPDGELVEAVNEKGRSFGVGTFNTKSLIAFRLLSRSPSVIDRAFFAHRIEEALKLRGDRFGESFRVVNSESDFLPGLVVDKYEKQVVVQLLTCGMELQKAAVVEAIAQVLAPDVIVLKNDSTSRKDEGLANYVEVVQGNADRHAIITVGPLRFMVDILAGHKTGFYFDQCQNRFLMKEFAPGKKVADVFAYTGGFGLFAQYFGAKSVVFVDGSSQALEICAENVKLNRLPNAAFVKSDAFDFLKESTDQYELLIVDPPSFIKSKKKTKEGERGYIDLNKKALRRLTDGGHLFTFSCSHNMKRSRFKDLLRITAYGNADLFLVRELSQAEDHPILLTIPETDYLKGLLVKLKRRH
jgi:23S rRNA (cytosine1962-C5)-methyltransferase